ncbi:MAG: outer membrane protein assembly factor BamE domain-containing protein [Candidatus Nucleicultricaceae bacterium]
MSRNLLVLSVATFVIGTVAGCKSVEHHTEGLAAASATDRNLTVGVVQSQIRVGMTQADVAGVLGSPNIVSKDQGNKESWIYDKIATEAYYSSSEGGAGIMGGAGGIAGKTLILGGVGANYSEKTGAHSQTQKTLTVIIKFDQAQRVESFTYHSSKF